MGQTQLKCPVIGCGRDAKFVRYIGEEIPMPVAMPLADLRWKPPFHELGRNFLVECSEHGMKCVQKIGHHVTNIPKKSNKATRKKTSKAS